MSAFIGSLSEAWAELRHHKLRVLLSLIGIAVSVGAIAAVFALGDYMRQSTIEQSDRHGGRAATLSISAWGADGAAIDSVAFDAAVQAAADRFEISHVSRRNDQLSVLAQVQTTDFVRPVAVALADPDYAVLHRTELSAGRWFTDDDARWLAPPVVISHPLWESLGATPLSAHPTVELTGVLSGTYQVIGVRPQEWPGDTTKSITLLASTYLDRAETLGDDSFTWELWIGTDAVDTVAPELAAQLRAAVGSGIDVSVTRADWATRPDVQQSAEMFEMITGLVAGLVLLLGGLGLVNIQLVAMRQRIREIGVRRSFGATGSRIFTTVLLENVVATAVAGIIGITLAIIVMRGLFAFGVLPSLQDTPPFPVRAAVIALVASVGIGAIAGFLPALTAVRSKVIDALRF